MTVKSNIQLKTIRSTSNKSGCILADYNITNNDTEISHVEDRINEHSGQFNMKHFNKK